MSFFSWLQNRTSQRAPRSRAQHRSAALRARPQLEALEDRWMPSTLTVTNLADGGAGSLRYEIAQAQSNDTIVFDPKLDHGTITLWSKQELFIGKNLTIQGPGAGLLTITPYLLPRYGTRIFEVFAPTVTISGLTISNGGGRASNLYSNPYDGWGGGVLDRAGARAHLTMTDCILSGNFAPSNVGMGGGAIASFATLTMSGCTLSNNSTINGDGGAIYARAPLTISGCTLSNNSTSYGYGGGIYGESPLTVSACTLTGNSASDGGGGIADFSRLMTVSGCTLTGNSAAPASGVNNGVGPALGGGGILGNSSMLVSTSVFSNNTPGNFSGGYTDGGGNIFS